MISVKSFLKPILGIGTEILYILIMMAVVFLICLIVT